MQPISFGVIFLKSHVYSDSVYITGTDTAYIIWGNMSQISINTVVL